MIFIIILVLWTSVAAFEIQEQRNEIRQSLLDFDRQISLAVAQSNRPFLEFIVENAFHQFDAEEISLCVDSKMEIEINAKGNLCTNSQMFGTFSKEITGFQNIRLVVKSNLISRISVYISILLFVLGLSLFAIKILNNLKRDIFLDIISPLDKLLDNDQDLRISEIQNIRVKLNEAIANEKKLVHANATVILAKQVAHDIRSPLSALTMIAGTFKDLPEEKRMLIRNATQRINDIANDLLKKGQQSQSSNECQDSIETKAISDVPLKLTTEFIPKLVDILISEKRMQYREYSGLEIDVDLKNSFGAFAEINSNEFKRVLSNLINNSVEALNNHQGKVVVGIKKVGSANTGKVEVSVKDNGKGIPPHILEKLGELGVTDGKDGIQSGSGLGVYHAKKTIESFRGHFQIVSTEGHGTEVRMAFPLAQAPQWFANKIDLTGKKYLVSLDDDSSIHQIWSELLQNLGSSEIEHIKFQSGEAFERYVNSNIKRLGQTLFLIDFELLNQNKTGLDIIEDLCIEKYSILVTSQDDDNDIQSRASRLKLPLLPKSLSGLVPIENRPSITKS
ncbi:MAG: sensor histidine kinase [Bdellovibrio sp.]